MLPSRILLAVALLAPVAGVAQRICGTSGGRVRFPDAEISFAPCAFTANWTGGNAVRGLLPAADGLWHWTIPAGEKLETSVRGTLEVKPGDSGAVRCAWTFVPEKDGHFAELALSGFASYSAYAGGSAEVDGKVIAFPSEKPADAALFRGTCRKLTLKDGKGVRRLSLEFEGAVNLLVQDDRAWGADGVRIRMILYGRDGVFPSGVPRTLALIARGAEPYAAGPCPPVVVGRGSGWTPIAAAPGIVAGSALDFSGICGVEAPAGRYGRVIAKGGHFEFENLPGAVQRFYGVNICGQANVPPTREACEKFAVTLRRTGYNALRIHHHDGVLAPVKADPAALTLDPERMRRFDNLVAAAVANGLYLTTDLYVSRSVARRAVGEDADGTLSMNEAKMRCYVPGPMQENFFAFASNFLCHVNAVTGRRLADEPALAFLSMVNEACFGNDPAFLAKQPGWKEAWAKWLAAKRREDAAFYSSVPDGFPTAKSADTPTGQAFFLFCQDVERDFARKVRSFVRSLGCRALLTDMNGVYYPLVHQVNRERDFDFVDDHFYVDHPAFPEKSWQLPSTCANRNPIANDALGVEKLAHRRVFGRPFTISEYNFSAPGRFRGVGGIVTGALGALQDWSGLWRFAWSHWLDGVLEPEKKTLGYFDMAGDPLGLASERASVCLFLRGDLEPLKTTYAVHLPEAVVSRPNGSLSGWCGAPFTWAGWYAKLGTALGQRPAEGADVVSAGTYPDVWTRKDEEVRTALGLAAPVDGEYPPAGGGAIRVNRTTGAFSISTPRTSGGFAESGTVRTPRFCARLAGNAATVWASSLDGRPIEESDRILVTHLTDVQDEGMTYADEELTILTRWGRLPHMMRNGRADCRVRVRPGDWTCYALAADGRRLRTVELSEPKPGWLGFAAVVEAVPDAATYLYELINERKEN